MRNACSKISTSYTLSKVLAKILGFHLTWHPCMVNWSVTLLWLFDIYVNVVLPYSTRGMNYVLVFASVINISNFPIISSGYFQWYCHAGFSISTETKCGRNYFPPHSTAVSISEQMGSCFEKMHGGTRRPHHSARPKIVSLFGRFPVGHRCLFYGIFCQVAIGTVLMASGVYYYKEPLPPPLCS